MLAPSNATPTGLVPTVKVPSMEPSLARSLVTVPPSKLGTHMLVPSKATSEGLDPTAKVHVPTQTPSLARSFVTVLSARLVTQMLAPSLEWGASDTTLAFLANFRVADHWS